MTIEIIVVSAGGGQYSDSWNYPVRAFHNEADADAYISRMEMFESIGERLLNVDDEKINFDKFDSRLQSEASNHFGEMYGCYPPEYFTAPLEDKSKYDEKICQEYDEIEKWRTIQINSWLDGLVDRIYTYRSSHETPSDFMTDEELKFLIDLKNNHFQEFFNLITNISNDYVYYKKDKITLV